MHAYKLLQTAAGMTGLPIAAATREIVTAWNNTIGAMAPSLKVKTYDSGPKNDIKYAFKDGYLSEAEATEELLARGLAESRNDAYWIIQEWKDEDGDYSKYDALDEAVRAGDSIAEEMLELTAHGISEENVLSHIKSAVGGWFRGGEIARAEAEKMLSRYTDIEKDDLYWELEKWESGDGDFSKYDALRAAIETGRGFDAAKKELLDHGVSEEAVEREATKVVTALYEEHKITDSEAVNLYAKYGGYSREAAVDKINVMKFVAQNPECDGITASAVSKYNEHCRGAGVTPKAFYDAWEYKNRLSGTVKAPMMTYINSLPLSSAQKDSLYFAFGWAASTLAEDAPWH